METALGSNCRSVCPARVKASTHLKRSKSVDYAFHLKGGGGAASNTIMYTDKKCPLHLQHHRMISVHHIGRQGPGLRVRRGCHTETSKTYIRS